MNKPIKRHKALKPLSRDHHHGLLLSWKIRTGIKKEVEIERIKKYCDFFFEEELIPHFNIEEQYIFTLLDANDKLVKRALSEHRKLKRLFTKEQFDVKNIVAIEELLEKHIRFEERVLFNKIQEQATEKELEVVEKLHQPNNNDNLEKWLDKFWE